MTAGAQRTPVSLLLDMCNQNEWTPEYELTSVIGASHEPTFTYRVKVEDVVATASGQSKKKAKHLAAKSALEQLLSKPDSVKKGFVFENVEVTAESLNDIVVEPVSVPVLVGPETKTAVGVLQEFCTKQNVGPPYYETVKDVGPPHDKVFTVECMVGSHTTVGEAKTKRIGKRIAAELMLEKLKEVPPKEVVPSEENSLNDSQKKNEEIINEPATPHMEPLNIIDPSVADIVQSTPDVESSTSVKDSATEDMHTNLNVKQVMDKLRSCMDGIHADSD